MSELCLSPAHLDYIQRSDAAGSGPGAAQAEMTTAPAALRRLWRIDGIGRLDKALLPMRPGKPIQTNGGSGRASTMSMPQMSARLTSEDALIGLYGYRIPLAFLVTARPAGVAIHWGTWSSAEREQASPAVLESRQEIVRTVLGGLFPAIELRVGGRESGRPPQAGFVTGIPTLKLTDNSDDALPIDRLIRALRGAAWGYLVLAVPLAESAVARLSNEAIIEMRKVEADVTRQPALRSLADHYLELLEIALGSMAHAQAVGAWRTAVYLFGDASSYYRLASVWRSTFSGHESLPEPIRVWDSPEAEKWVESWSLADLPGSEGPGAYRRPYEYQTVLSSSQLAAYVHLPNIETSGFQIRVVPDFDAVPPAAGGGPALSLGRIIHRGRATETDYGVSRKSLTRHAFVAGVTGAGKTNTIIQLVRQAYAQGVPFLVIEPTKTEYRSLIDAAEVGQRLAVFTPGNETVSPFRLNPFEVVAWPHTAIGTHLDLLKSLFTASFGMWTPLPQVLERCLHEIYQDRGWDTAANTNQRIAGKEQIAAAFPTLSDLYAKVDEVIRELGYEARVTDDMRAALRTRIDGLRAGGKGRMLDVQQSLPMEVLVQQPAVLELEGMGDDDDKAFMIGLLLLRLAEYRRAQGAAADLRHLLVIEEAHRLLANAGPRQREEEADPRSKAIEAFANLLAEIRAYGQGVIVTDQIPVKLAPDVIKNTNLKIAHRVVAVDDRAILAGAMGMNERQEHTLATLCVGEAAVFAEGDDAPLLVRVPLAKDANGGDVTHGRVAQHMQALGLCTKYRSLYLPLPACAEVCAQAGDVCLAARGIVEDRALQRTFCRLVLSVFEDGDALDRLWVDFLTVVFASCPAGMDKEKLLQCVALRTAAWYAERRGAQNRWTYGQTEELARHLRLLLLAKLGQKNLDGPKRALREFGLALQRRTYDPFVECSHICGQRPPVCLYRQAVADLVAEGSMNGAWQEAEAGDARDAEGRRQQTWEVCQDAGYALIEWPEQEWPAALQQAVTAAGKRVCLCFAQQMLANDQRKSPRTARRIMAKILKEAGV